MNNSKIILGIILKNIQKKGLTEKQCLVECNINTSFLTDWKNEKIKNPSIDKIVKLSEYLNIDLNYMLLGKKVCMDELSDEEYNLLEIYNNVDKEDKIRIMERAQTLLEQAEALREKNKQQAVQQSSNCVRFVNSEVDGDKFGEEEEEDEGYIEIPLYDTSASAGTGIDIDYTSSEPIKVSDEYDEAYFAVRVSGDSMEPRYVDGDIVIVEPAVTIDEGEIGIFILNGQAFIKKLGTGCLISLNKKYDPIQINEYDSIYCQGRVIGVIPSK